ncbi:MAG TPA: hypothetical protein VG675_01885 [Bryobacteraceae bacterium]|nr:hypothetical protein [Bryobacteraceae bacterium]
MEGRVTSTIRSILPYTSAGVIIALVYCGWIFYSRWSSNRRIAAEAQAEEARQAAKVVEMTGGDELKILSFYASPSAIHRGERTLICYGAANAATVRIEPPVGDIGPSLSRCLEIHPKATTTYKLTIADQKGHQQTQDLVVQVAP